MINAEENKFKIDNYKHSDLTEKIIKEVYYVYNYLGGGFLEKVYENALCKKLIEAGFKVNQQCCIKVYFENEIVGDYLADIIINDLIIIELKALENLLKIHEVQLVNYLKATKYEVGLLINFGPKLEIKRKVNSNVSV